MKSRPLRARGLKRLQLEPPSLITVVAPPAGAWIETLQNVMKSPSLLVAPPAGAWIETLEDIRHRDGRKRRAPCGRA